VHATSLFFPTQATDKNKNVFYLQLSNGLQVFYFKVGQGLAPAAVSNI